MNPSTSLGTRANVGMAKPSPAVRQTGNIWHLLLIRGVGRRSLPMACAHVKYRCRYRVIAIPGKRALHVIEYLGQHAVDEAWRHGRLPGPVRFFERERQILLHLERSREGLREPFEGC